MRKTLLAMGITLALLSIVLAGCDQPTDFNVSESIQSIQGPANVTVTAQTGALKVEWDLVTDATSYEIRRRENVDGARYEVVGTKTSTESVFWDVISRDNILADGKTYVYEVIAVSGAATRTVGEVVQSGVTTAEAFTVPAGIFPAIGTATVVKPVTNVAATIATNGKVTVTWDSANELPVTYTFARHSPSGASYPRENTYYTTDVSGEGYFRGAVSAVWPNDYYPSSDAVALAEVKYAIPTVALGIPSFSVNASRDAGAEKVIVSWSPVFSATGYILQKYEWAKTSATPGTTIPADLWTDVTEAQTTKVDGSIYVETTVPVDSSARYRLIVQTAKGTSDPASAATATVSPVSPSTYSVSLNVTSQRITADDPANPLDTSRNAIVFTFNTDDPEDSYTYSLYRQAVGETNGQGTDVKGDYELVPGIQEKFASAPGTANYGGVVKQQYTPDLQRQQYNYRVALYNKDGVLDRDVIYSSGPLAAKSPASSIINYVNAATSPSGNANAETVWYKVELNYGSALQSGETIYVYGRRDPNYPAPNSPAQNQPLNTTTPVGTARYCDGSSAYPYPTPSGSESVPSSPGYYVRGSAYFTNLSAEVK